MKTVLCFALQQEAAPFIAKLKAKHLHQQKYLNLYETPDTLILISGIGYINMSAAIGWLTGFLKQELIIWNLGCAGCGANLYNWYRVAQITNLKEESFYPEIYSSNPLELKSLITSNEPAGSDLLNRYPGLLFDMEGYAFAKASQLFLSTSQIQLIKWVSDNGDFSFYKNKNWESEYSKNIDFILHYIFEENKNIARLIQVVHPHISPIIHKVEKRLKLSFTQTEQLKNAIYYNYQYNNESVLQKKIDTVLNECNEKLNRKIIFNKLLATLHHV